MENKEKESHIEFGLHYGLIEPLEKQEGKYKYQLTKKGEEIIKVASYYLLWSLVFIAFRKRSK